MKKPKTSSRSPRPVRVLAVASHVQPSTDEIARADVFIQGRVVVKHRYGRGMVLTPRELERVKAGDLAPIGVGI